MTISISELKKISEMLFKYLEQNGIKEILLEKDYYWFVSSDDLFNVSQDPVSLTVGQLTEDLDELMEDRTRGPIGRSFVRYSSLLRYLGEKID